jgi:hypothetical protein
MGILGDLGYTAECRSAESRCAEKLNVSKETENYRLKIDGSAC